MSTLFLVAALLWAVPAYATWLWWLHQANASDDIWLKWGLVVGATILAPFWPLYVRWKR